MKEITVDATLENITAVTAFLDEYLEGVDAPMKAQMQLDVALDELFSNIARYAYSPSVGKATVRIEDTEEKPGVRVIFIDSGIPYDPTAKKDPDITLSAEDRAIGGLGIFMVRKTMDDMSYKRENDSNILTITKYF